MKFSYTIPCDRAAEVIWPAWLDGARLIRCLPGCTAVEPAGPDQFEVRLTTGIGPVRLQVGGRAKLQYDSQRQSLTADVSLNDGRAGSVYGAFELTLKALAPGQSELGVAAEVVLGGKLGEFAQPLLRRKADQTMREFVANLMAQVD